MSNDQKRADHHYELAVNISMQALKGLLIVNGGAAVALIDR